MKRFARSTATCLAAASLAATLVPSLSLAGDEDGRSDATDIPYRGTADFGASRILERTDTVCGVRVDFPHASNRYSEQIHTRAESKCFTFEVIQNQLDARTSRGRWYGWQLQGSESASATAPGPRAQHLRLTVAIKCRLGSRYRYRTEARGRIGIPSQTLTAGAYEQNDDEVTCVRRD
jgi:hypothetical protein